MTERNVILIALEDQRMASLLADHLSINEQTIRVVTNATDGLFCFKNEQIDLVVSSQSLKNKQGQNISFLQEVRKISPVPIVAVINQQHQLEINQAFKNGLDEVITVPFNGEEAALRITRLFNYYDKNRVAQLGNEVIKRDFIFDPVNREVNIKNKKIKLTDLESKTLNYLIQHENLAISRQTLLVEVWGYEYFGKERSVDVLIRKLRNKLAQYSVEAASCLETVWKKGYRYQEK